MQNYKRGHFVRARSFKSPFLQCRQHGRVKFTFTDGSGNLDLLFLVARMALLAVALLLLTWSYRSVPATGGVRICCAFLKLLGFLALAACLLEPLWSGQRARPGVVAGGRDVD